MSLDITFSRVQKSEVFSRNITHNLGRMAGAAGIYEHLWEPDKVCITRAGELIEPLTNALKELRARPEFYKKYNANNGWGVYEHFIEFVEDVLEAATTYPDASIDISR